MGLFDDFEVNMDEVKESSFDVADGTYEFEISEAGQRNGSNTHPDTIYFVIVYDLGEDGQKQIWRPVAERVDGEVTQTTKNKQQLSMLKTDLLALGFEAASLNDVTGEDLEGIRGVLTLNTRTTPKGSFQNVKIVSVEDDDAPAPEPEPKPAPKAAPAARRAPARRTSAAASEDAETANPFA